MLLACLQPSQQQSVCVGSDEEVCEVVRSFCLVGRLVASHELVLSSPIRDDCARKVVTILHNASSGTIARGKYLLSLCGVISTRRSSRHPGRDSQGPRLLLGPTGQRSDGPDSCLRIR